MLLAICVNTCFFLTFVPHVVCSLLRTYLTRLLRRRRENTSLKGSFRVRIVSSWMWNVQVSRWHSKWSPLEFYAWFKCLGHHAHKCLWKWMILHYVGCYKITTVFSHAQTVVLCVSCSTVLAQPTGGRARLTEGKPVSPVSPVTICSTFLQVAVSDGSHIEHYFLFTVLY